MDLCSLGPWLTNEELRAVAVCSSVWTDRIGSFGILSAAIKEEGSTDLPKANIIKFYQLLHDHIACQHKFYGPYC